jgi:hypothetical protein
LGVAIVRESPDSDSDDVVGNLVGKRLVPYVYSGKIIVTISDFNKKVKDECDRVRNLKSEKLGFWIQDGREKGRRYRNDSVVKLTGIAEATQVKLDNNGIKTLGDLNNLNDLEVSANAKSAGLVVSKMIKRREYAANCVDEDSPERTDHRKANNPYISKYGEADWKQSCAKSVMLSSYLCIPELVRHIHDETQKVMKGFTMMLCLR